MSTNNQYNCRFCLCETVEPRNMIQDDDFQQKTFELFNGIDINITPENGLSVLVCEYCYNLIRQFHHFYLIVKENQDYLLSEQNNIKIEDETYDFEDQGHVNSEDFIMDETDMLMKTEISKNNHIKDASRDVIQTSGVESKSLYICDYCGKCFITKVQITSHVLKCTANERKSRKNRPSYRRVPKPEELIISCPICPPNALKFKSQEILALHFTEHDRFERIDQSRAAKNLPPLMQCPHCERRFSIDEEFEAHLQNHQVGRFMTCELCGRSIVSSSLKTHLKLHFKRFCCEFCSHKFRHRCDLVKHIRLNHERPDSYQCNFCLKKIKYKTALAKHLEFCRGPGSVGPCVHCGQTFGSRSDRMYHVQKYHLGYVCRTCHVQVENVTALKNHRKSEEHKQKCHLAKLQREELKQQKMETKKAPLRKVVFGINLT